jgi:Phage integrase family
LGAGNADTPHVEERQAEVRGARQQRTEILRKIPGRGERVLIFPDCRKISHRFPEWAAEAKLPGKVTFHTLRHTFASWLVMAGVDLLTVKALGGWNRLELVERYSHLAPANKRAAVERLAQADPLRGSDSASGTYTGTGSSAVGGQSECVAVQLPGKIWCRSGDSNPDTLAGTRP